MTGTVRALVLAISLALALAGSANAAAPRLIMVDGKSLEGQVLISDAEDVFELYQAFFEGQAVDQSALMGRQSLRLGLFWDDRLWEPYVQEGRLGELRFKQANQVGRFYPATDGHPALVDLPAEDRWPRTAKGTALRVLETHDVPIRVGARTTERVWVWAAVGGVGLVSLGWVCSWRGASVASVVRLIRRRRSRHPGSLHSDARATISHACERLGRRAAGCCPGR